MKPKSSSTTKDDKSLDILKRLAKRMEDATVDIHEMKRDLKFVNLRLSNVESNTKIMKVDIENTRTDLEASELRTEERAQKHRDRILTGIDKVMKELESVREDRTIGNHHKETLKKQVDIHEKRIKQLEQTHAVA